MADNDAQLELKKRARRRLIGAIALVLAAAVFLPMVMDSEPRSTGNDLQIRIPSQEGSAYTSRLVTAPASGPQAAARPASTTPVVIPADPEGPVSAPAVAVPVEKPAAEKSSSSKSSKATEPAKPETSESRARALLETGTEPAPTAAPKFFVQLGVYHDTANVKSALAKLKQAGVAASTEKVGDKTRVRAGPFKTRQQADQALAKAKKAGLNGSVVSK